MLPSSAPRWMLPVAYVAFALGAIVLGIALIQMVADVAWLDDPWTGAVGCWLLALVLYGLAKRAGHATTQRSE